MPSCFITTPIYYVNDRPHIGHAYTTIACDVMARFKRLDGYDVKFLTGTDEHGQKIARVAQDQGISPQELADKNSQNFRDLAKALNISNDDFIRTTEERHKVACQALWTRLKDRGHIKPGEKLLVLGAAGGVGLAAVELGVAMGAEVIAAASSQDKVDFCISKGAHKGFVYPENPLSRDQQKAFSDQIKDISGGGVDVIYDGVGGDYAEPAVRALNWDGRFLVIGFPAGIPKLPLNLTLLKSCQIVGVFWGAFVARDPKAHADNLADLFRLYREGKIRPHVSNRYPLERAADAIKELSERRAKGKVVITI